MTNEPDGGNPLPGVDRSPGRGSSRPAAGRGEGCPAPRNLNHDALVRGNLGLALHVARKFTRSRPDLADELRSAALLGLCHAALTFDPSRGTFGTWGYACCSQRCNAVLRAERERARRFPEARPVVGDDGEQVEAVDLLTTEPAPEQHAATAHTSILVRAALAELPERERCVMRMRYFDDRTLADIGVILSVSRERARQIHARALGRLRARFA